MSKVKIVLEYDTDDLWIYYNGVPIGYDTFGITSGTYPPEEILFDKTPQPEPKTSLDKLTKLRSMNLSVDEIRELNEMGLL